MASLAGPRIETSDLHAAGWTQPPGSRWVEYTVPKPRVLPEVQWMDREPNVNPTIARIALASDTVQGDVRPQVTQGIYLAETTRRALMGRSRDESGLPSRLFSGKDEDGRPLRGHQHAFFLTCDDDEDGRIDHLLVYVRGGMGHRELEAIAGIKKLWQVRHKPDLFPVLVGMGQAEEFGSNQPGMPGRTRLLGRSRYWSSATPYLLTRHPKKNGKESPAEQLRRDLERMGLPEPVGIEQMPDGRPTRRKTFRWLEFARERQTGGKPPAQALGYGFRITFDEPVTGPIALGYGAHFGLGTFVAEEDKG